VQNPAIYAHANNRSAYFSKNGYFEPIIVTPPMRQKAQNS